jgi:hypothetical protein
MKKTIFTTCSIALVCCAIIMACSKTDNDNITHVGYAVQMGTGKNPNPNQTPATSGYGTTTSTTSSTTTTGTTAGTTAGTTTSTNTVTPVGTFTANGTAYTASTKGINAAGNYEIDAVASSGPSISIGFFTSTAPTSGAYSIVGLPATASQCQFSYTDASTTLGVSSAGTVNITTGSPNSATFSGIVCVCGSTTYTISGTIQY